MATLKKAQRFPLRIKRLGINGEGIGYYQKMAVFVPGALPQEEIIAQVEEVSPRYVTASIVKFKKRSRYRVEPKCPVFGICGGCQLQHLAYSQQLVFKKELIKQALTKYKPAGYSQYKLLDTAGMKKPWHYRNKLQYQIQEKHDGTLKAGLYKIQSHQVVDLKACPVQREETTLVANQVLNIVQKLKIPIYNEKEHRGFLRTLMVRIGVATKEVQVVFITTTENFPEKDKLLQEMAETLPQVVSIMQNIHPAKTSLVMGDKTILLAGKPAIKEKSDEISFDLSARAFFQLNPVQTRVLYSEALKALDPQKDEVIVDAYCGVGTIGLKIAPYAKEVRGMDIIPSAIEDAKKNAANMQLTNMHYEVGTAEEVLANWWQAGFRPDGIVVDPPRTGLGESLRKSLLRYPAKKLVYISCNPSTLAKDLVDLTKCYQVEYIQSVDMFPQTARAEAVVKLTLKDQ